MRKAMFKLSLGAAVLLVLSLVDSSPSQARRPPGIQGMKAPEVWAKTWKNGPSGQSRFSVKAQQGKIIYLFFFQSWCPGCHSRGFPSLRAVAQHFKGQDDVVFAAVQTVFEGFSVNSPAKAWSSMAEFGLALPIGHDAGPDGKRSMTMARYRSGGTPWTVVIGPRGIVRFNGFHLPPQKGIALIESLRRQSLP